MAKQDLNVTENDRIEIVKLLKENDILVLKANVSLLQFRFKILPTQKKKGVTFNSRECANQNFAKSLEGNTSLLEYHFCVSWFSFKMTSMETNIFLVQNTQAPNAATEIGKSLLFNKCLQVLSLEVILCPKTPLKKLNSQHL